MGKLSMAFLAATLAWQASSGRLAVDGGEIPYDVTGSGPAVVFLHGGFMERSAWDLQIPEFAKSFRAIRYDIRPFGQSSAPAKPYRTSQDLLQLLDHLKVDRAHLIGHSFGGQVAIDFALTHPARVAGLVLVGAAPSGFTAPPEEAKLIAPIFAAAKQGEDAVVKAWLEHPMWSVVRSRPEVRKVLEDGTRRNMHVFAMSAPPYVPLDPPAIKRLAEIKAPTLILVGDRDMPSIQQVAAMMAKQIAGASLRIVPGADHALPIGWAKEFNGAVLAFLKALR
jgi:pimeloyl-ACP methyl ester carboxylesterase